jgi:hypothetical protein
MLFRPFKFMFFINIFFLAFMSFAQADDNATVTTTTTSNANGAVVEKRVIVTTVPAPKEVIVTPEGYANCFSVTAGWYQDIWVAEHRVCQYANMPNGVAWVEGYWACTKYDIPSGNCTNWDWKAAHWEKTLIVY